MRRVVITGMGVVSSLGNDKETFWNNIKAGKCGLGTVTRFDITDYPSKIAAEVNDFDPALYMDPKEAKRMDKFTQFAIAAAKQAIEEAGLDFSKIEDDRAGVIIGSGIGGIETFEQQCNVLFEKGARRVSPFFIPMQIANMASGQIAIQWGIKGVNETVVTACASGTNALGEAYRCIKHGYADVIVSGGTEAPLSPIAFAGFCNMKAMSTRDNPLRASTPFDAERDGFIMGEGAGILIMEDLEFAKARGANIIAEIVGYGSTDDAHHITMPAPNGEGGARAMALAVKEGGIKKEEVDYINAHGTSTPYNDKFETMAIKTVFGEHAYKLAVSSTKSMTGHLLGAAGGIEGIITALSLNEGFIPATIGHEVADPELDLDYVLNKGRKQDIKYALSNSFGFGGHNASILLKKFED